ncbi:PLP-dependent transferase [uncultured Umboniibacter sp.]|uniref:trans-sulfuration enzyme family protein n=1 Tax=uncultured Umboniibacter sp. TaxID=1798917 RepID=UPI002624A103|nr:PLP-dependent transferase [uncultured Umboniibacter sp.]
MSDKNLSAMKNLSPLRKTSHAQSALELAREQLQHFGIDPNSEYGEALIATTNNLYKAQGNLQSLWDVTTATLPALDQSDRIRYFNAKKFLAFQMAKLLDNLQNPFRSVYQQFDFGPATQLSKGSYPIFDNVPALFSATPVVVKTATYIYACTEWVDDAFTGREPTHQIYSRLLNPTSIALANAIVDLEAGPFTQEYLAWNYNSGMAAIDGILSNKLRLGDVLIVSRNVYGGVHQLLVDYFAQRQRLDIQIEWFDELDASSFEAFLHDVKVRHADRLQQAKLHVYLESPCNPHGYVLDVPNICAISHREGHCVILDSTLATPFLHQPLQRTNPDERPDYVVHSYTKDLSGGGSTTAGVVIGKIETMFMPKGETINGVKWSDTMFWDVYYIKGAFLDADKAAEVMSGMKTLEQRMLHKGIATRVFTAFLASNPMVRVNSNAVPAHPNHQQLLDSHYLGLPSPLFTVDFENANVDVAAFKRFFDALEPCFSHQVSIGQTNTLVLCPALTSHSELSGGALADANIYPTTIRISMGTEDVRELMAHLYLAAKIHIDPLCEGFSSGFDIDNMDALLLAETKRVYEQHVGAGKSLKKRLA